MQVPGRTRKPMWSSFHRMDELEESWTGHIVVGSNKVTNDLLSLNDERPWHATQIFDKLSQGTDGLSWTWTQHREFNPFLLRSCKLVQITFPAVTFHPKHHGNCRGPYRKSSTLPPPSYTQSLGHRIQVAGVAWNGNKRLLPMRYSLQPLQSLKLLSSRPKLRKPKARAGL